MLIMRWPKLFSISWRFFRSQHQSSKKTRQHRNDDRRKIDTEHHRPWPSLSCLRQMMGATRDWSKFVTSDLGDDVIVAETKQCKTVHKIRKEKQELQKLKIIASTTEPKESQWYNVWLLSGKEASSWLAALHLKWCGFNVTKSITWRSRAEVRLGAGELTLEMPLWRSFHYYHSLPCGNGATARCEMTRNMQKSRKSFSMTSK